MRVRKRMPATLDRAVSTAVTLVCHGKHVSTRSNAVLQGLVDGTCSVPRPLNYPYLFTKSGAGARPSLGSLANSNKSRFGQRATNALGTWWPQSIGCHLFGCLRELMRLACRCDIEPEPSHALVWFLGQSPEFGFAAAAAVPVVWVLVITWGRCARKKEAEPLVPERWRPSVAICPPRSCPSWTRRVRRN